MNIKKIFSGIMAVCLMGTVMSSVDIPANEAVITASAEEYTNGTYEQLEYKNYGGHIEISGCDKSATEVEIPAEIDGVPVTSIRRGTFSSCKSLTSVTIPDGIKRIGMETFYECKSLTSITIPDSVTSIGKRAFYDCWSLTSITIPDNVTNIETEAFDGCVGLTSIIIPDSVKSMGNSVFCWTNLKSVIISNSITNIGEGTFAECTSLASVTIPNSVTSIGKGAFCDCYSLTSITIPDSVTSIGQRAFCVCYDLTSIIILNPECDIYDSSDTIANKNDNNGKNYFNGTIYGYEDSTAQEYAEKYGYNFEVINDVNGDEEFNMADAVLFQKFLLGDSDAVLSDWQKFDLCADGRLDVFDFCMMKKKIIEDFK